MHESAYQFEDEEYQQNMICLAQELEDRYGKEFQRLIQLVKVRGWHCVVFSNEVPNLANEVLAVKSFKGVFLERQNNQVDLMDLSQPLTKCPERVFEEYMDNFSALRVRQDRL